MTPPIEGWVEAPALRTIHPPIRRSSYAHALVELVDTCHALRAASPIAQRLLKRTPHAASRS